MHGMPYPEIPSKEFLENISQRILRCRYWNLLTWPWNQRVGQHGGVGVVWGYTLCPSKNWIHHYWEQLGRIMNQSPSLHTSASLRGLFSLIWRNTRTPAARSVLESWALPQADTGPPSFLSPTSGCKLPPGAQPHAGTALLFSPPASMAAFLQVKKLQN